MKFQYVHDPHDIFSDTRSLQFPHGAHYLKMKFQLNAVVASNRLRFLTVKQRKCRFRNEPIEENYLFLFYTEHLCLISCRILTAVRVCGCRPFFYNVGEQSLSFFFCRTLKVCNANKIDNYDSNSQIMVKFAMLVDCKYASFPFISSWAISTSSSTWVNHIKLATK